MAALAHVCCRHMRVVRSQSARRRAAWPLHVMLARYPLYSFHYIPAAPAIFLSIFQHILVYLDTDNPIEGPAVGGVQNRKENIRHKLREIDPKAKQPENASPARGISSFVLPTRFELFGNSIKLEDKSEKEILPRD